MLEGSIDYGVIIVVALMLAICLPVAVVIVTYIIVGWILYR